MSTNVDHQAKFAAAFVAGVLGLLRTGIFHEVAWDQEREDFDARPVDEATSPTDVDFLIGDSWANWLNEVPLPPPPASRDSSDVIWEAFAVDLMQAVRESGKDAWMLNVFHNVYLFNRPGLKASASQ